MLPCEFCPMCTSNGDFNKMNNFCRYNAKMRTFIKSLEGRKPGCSYWAVFCISLAAHIWSYIE